MRHVVSVAFALMVCLVSFGVTGGNDSSEENCIKVQKVERKVGTFKLDSMSLGSPLDFYLSRAWLRVNGHAGLWHDISTIQFSHILDPDAPDEQVSEEMRERLLNDSIISICTYHDSVAVILSQDFPGRYLLTGCWIERGKWVNGGDDMRDDWDEACAKAESLLVNMYANLPRIGAIADVPEDVTPFAEFAKSVKDSPEEYLLEKLRGHRLVINGEYHRRKVSWDMLKRLISMRDFPEVVGTVFMELPSWKQPVMDTFMESDTLDVEKVYDIFRDEQPNGWWDRGECEFICELWKVNRSLPAGRCVKVVLVDYQVPYSLMESEADAIETEDRNTHMAETISEYIASSDNSRSCLFLVGCAHAYKSQVSGLFSTPDGMAPSLTAGAQLSRRLGTENVFAVFQHVRPGDNSGRYKTSIRDGLFDSAFSLNGNRPIGFDLKGSPFGRQPFDGILEIKFDSRTGTFSDNFDGYLFLHTLENEPQNTPLLEIFTDGFVDEMKRRADVLGTNEMRGYWFGVKADELTPDHVRKALAE